MFTMSSEGISPSATQTIPVVMKTLPTYIRGKSENINICHIIDNIFYSTKYSTLSALGADSIWGQITTYRGGGFVRSLSYNFNENNKILSDLKSRKWLDRASRLILVEFTLYNANKDLVNNIK